MEISNLCLLWCVLVMIQCREVTSIDSGLYPWIIFQILIVISHHDELAVGFFKLTLQLYQQMLSISCNPDGIIIFYLYFVI